MVNSLVCAHCKAQNRVTKPVLVPYMTAESRGRSERRSFYVCWFCDSTDVWPNFSRTSPPLPRE